MTTLVWGHGTRDRGEEKTFLLEGTTVKWFSDLDQNLFTRNGFVAVSRGEFGSPNDQQGPGRGTEVEIYNSGLSQDLVKRDYVAMLNREGLLLMFIGAEIPDGHLCNDWPGAKRRASTPATVCSAKPRTPRWSFSSAVAWPACRTRAP